MQSMQAGYLMIDHKFIRKKNKNNGFGRKSFISNRNDQICLVSVSEKFQLTFKFYLFFHSFVKKKFDFFFFSQATFGEKGKKRKRKILRNTSIPGMMKLPVHTL